MSSHPVSDPRPGRDDEADDRPGEELGRRVGSYRYWFDDDIWEWSPEVAAMHGYPNGDVVPTTELLRSHKYPEDRATFDALVDTMRRTRTHFSSRHRIVDTSGHVHSVAVLGRTFTHDGLVAGSEGYYLDLGVIVGDSVRTRVSSHVETFQRQRSAIEQAKGMLMLVYNIDEDQAFDLLRWRSQQENRKLRELCQELVAGAPVRVNLPESVRRDFDVVVLSPFDEC